VEFVVNKEAPGQVFSEYFGFPFKYLFHQPLLNHHASSGAGAIGQIMADKPSGTNFTPPKGIKKYIWLP
jgi:hypothetical protein